MTGFIIGVVSAVVGAVVGVIIKHIQDNKVVRELVAELVDQAKELDRQEVELRKMQGAINRYNDILCALKEQTVVRMKGDCNADFFKVNDLPIHFDKDVDFGGNF